MEIYLNFLTYAGLGFVLLFVGLYLFEITTKVEEFKLIGQGNVTAGLVLGGRLFGLSFVIGSAIAHSINLVDMIIWSAIGIVAQIILYILSEVLTVRFNIGEAIEKDNRALGVFLLLMSLSVGWMIAQSLTY